jgi:hypothetical protein
VVNVELLIAAVVGGVLLTVALMTVLWKIVSAAVDNGLDWLIHTFGNEERRSRSGREVARQGGLVMSALGVPRG